MIRKTSSGRNTARFYFRSKQTPSWAREILARLSGQHGRNQTLIKYYNLDGRNIPLRCRLQRLPSTRTHSFSPVVHRFIHLSQIFHYTSSDNASSRPFWFFISDARDSAVSVIFRITVNAPITRVYLC